MKARPLSPELARSVLLILAELVTNAFKHSDAGASLELGIALAVLDDRWDLRVTSPGSGRIAGAAPPPRLASQLAASLGGMLEVQASCPFTVRVVAPMT